MKVTSYIEGKWLEKGIEKDLISAVTNKPIAQMVETDIDYKSALEYARNVGFGLGRTRWFVFFGVH